MGFLILAAFIGVPLIEIALFIEVGGALGLWPTILVVVLTAMAGTALLRHQGLRALDRLQDSLGRGEPPMGPVFDGFCLLGAGALLLTPGFFTDAVGFLLFVPQIRAALGRFFARHLETKVQAGQVHTSFHWQAGPGPERPSRPGGDIIDGEFEDVTKPNDAPHLPGKDDKTH
ncbi:FxsA family protein [Pseudomonadota bacterium]